MNAKSNLRGFNPLLRGAWAARRPGKVYQEGDSPVVSIPSFAGHGLRAPPSLAAGLTASSGFQSPPSRGMGCERSSPSVPTKGARSFNPLLRGAWAARPATSKTQTIRAAVRFNPLLRGAWAARRDFFRLTEIGDSAVSIPSFAGHGLRDDAVWASFGEEHWDVSIPSFAGHGLRVAGWVLPPNDAVWGFNPLLRGAWAARSRTTAWETSSSTSSFNPLLRGAWAASYEVDLVGYSLVFKFQSPPSRGMGCESGTRAPCRAPWNISVSIPSFAGHGLRVWCITWGDERGALEFQSPPSRGMGCEVEIGAWDDGSSYYVSIPSFAGHGLRVARTAEGRPVVIVSIPSFAGHGLRVL